MWHGEQDRRFQRNFGQVSDDFSGNVCPQPDIFEIVKQTYRTKYFQSLPDFCGRRNIV